MDIYIDNRQKKVEVSDKIEEVIRKSIETAVDFLNVKENMEVSVILADNELIRKLNREYRGRDTETDVLSFPMMEEYFEDGKEIVMMGDIVLSMEKALEQCEEYGHGIEREISYLTVHSVLHLQGYDHMTEKEKEIMRSKEKEIMKKLEIYK